MTELFIDLVITCISIFQILSDISYTKYLVMTIGNIETKSS